MPTICLGPIKESRYRTDLHIVFYWGSAHPDPLPSRARGRTSPSPLRGEGWDEGALDWLIEKDSIQPIGWVRGIESDWGARDGNGSFYRRHQHIGQLHHLADQAVRKGSVQDDRVPMLLVHVVSGLDRRKLLAQGQGPEGVAFQVGVPDPFRGPQGGEHLSPGFINRYLGPEGKSLLGARFGKE